MSTAVKQHEPASLDRLTSGETAEVLKEIQRHFVIRTSAVIDDETDRLHISELCDRPPESVYGATDDLGSLIASFRKAVRLADQHYAGGFWDAEMKSSGEAMDRASRVPANERASVIQEQLNAWRERSAEVVRVWAPQFFVIARSFPKQVSEPPSQWTKAKLLEGVNRRLRPAQLGAVTFWMKAAFGERDKKDFDPSESQAPWRIPTWFVTRSTASAQVMGAAISQAPALEKISFVRRGDETMAERNFTDNALLNTYESFSVTLDQVRTSVIAKNGECSIKELRNKFGRTELGKAAADGDWATWIEIFADERTPPKAAALVFLEKTTGRERTTIKKRCSTARKRGK